MDGDRDQTALEEWGAGLRRRFRQARTAEHMAEGFSAAYLLEHYSNVMDGILQTEIAQLERQVSAADTANEWKRASALLHQYRTAALAVGEAEIEALRAQLDAPPPGAPERGAAIDTWLDWRATKKKQGRRITHKQLEKWSGFSLSYIKKKSSARKPRGTPKNRPQRNKKVHKSSLC